MEEDLGRGPNNIAGELIHQSHSPHQPPWLQTQPPRPYNSILVAMHNRSNWTFLIWFSFTLWGSLFLTLSFTLHQASHSFPFPWVWSSALIPICCCHSKVAPNYQSFTLYGWSTCPCVIFIIISQIQLDEDQKLLSWNFLCGDLSGLLNATFVLTIYCKCCHWDGN